MRKASSNLTWFCTCAGDSVLSPEALGTVASSWSASVSQCPHLAEGYPISVQGKLVEVGGGGERVSWKTNGHNVTALTGNYTSIRSKHI